MNLWSVVEWFFEWWPWLVGAVGLTGAIALCVFFAMAGPVAVFEFLKVAMKALGTFFAWVLSYRLGCAILAALLWGGAIDLWQRHYDAQACAASIVELKAQAERAGKERDATIAADIAKAYQPRIDQLNAKSEDLQKQVAEYEKTILANTAAGACQLGDDALKLRKPKRKPAAAQR